MYEVIFLGQPPVTQWFNRRAVQSRKTSILPVLADVNEDHQNSTGKKNPMKRGSSMNALPKLPQKRSSVMKPPPLRRASTRSSMSEGGSPLPSKCHDIAVNGETIIVSEIENRLKLYSVEAGVRLLGTIARDSAMSCSGTHLAHSSTRGTTFCSLRDKPILLTPLTGVIVRQISAGNGYTVICTNDGKVFSWGKGDRGCLGQGDTDGRKEPQQILTLPFTEIVHVSAAHCHTSLVSSDGEVYMCGSGSKGQLGTGNNSDAIQPVALDVSDSAKMACCGGDENHPFTLILTVAGTVLSSGDAENGKLGIGSKWSKKTFSAIGKIHFGNNRVDTISAGVDHSLALTSNKVVFQWGLITAEDRHGVVRTRVENTPKQLEHPSLQELVPEKIFAGHQYSVICGQSSRPH
ncbi:RCC1 and BTB domain-containing protein 2-like [Bolinopsis microptera]|uniref:RCC1 and BTB domain-containing protein 2-like n=1 Tax=Bolinopsis microptera TaxID=2820187 RepID=UPI00307ACF06